MMSSLSGFLPSGRVKKLQKQVPSKSTSPLITGSQTQIESSLLAGWQGQKNLPKRSRIETKSSMVWSAFIRT